MARQRILVIDDNPINLKITRALIVRAGYEASAAETAERALELLSSFQPQLIITDIQLPGMDGLEFTRHIKQQAEWKRVPVIALTALDSRADEQKVREAGCDGFLSKPVDGKALASVIQTHLPGGGGAAAPVQQPLDSMQSLRTQFLSEGGARCRELLTRLRAYMVPRSVAPMFDNRDFRSVFHQWAGVAGSLGFPGITEKAREAEGLVVLPLQQMAPQLRTVLEQMLELFTAAVPVEPAEEQVPAAILDALMGKRFALVQLEAEDSRRLTPLLEKVEGLYREVSLQAALTPKPFRAYDIILCNPAGLGDEGKEVVRHIFESGLPVLFLGSRQQLGGVAQIPSKYAVEYLPGAWAAKQVLACAWTLFLRKAEMDASPTAAPPRKPVILLADDDAILRTLIKSALESLGMECRVAENGQLALAMARNAPPDLAILDVNMPHKSGFEVLNALRGLERTKHLRVMLLTGSQEEADINRGLSFGADEYVIKPVDPLELATRVRRLLAQPR